MVVAKNSTICCTNISYQTTGEKRPRASPFLAWLHLYLVDD